MTEEKKQQFYSLARSSVRPDKKAEMETLLAEAEKAYNDKTFSKSYMTTLGMRAMGLIRIECMADFIKQGKEMAKDVGIDA